MSMFSIEPSNLSLSLTLGLTLGLSACQILPGQPHLPESQALSARVNALYQQANNLEEAQNKETENKETDSSSNINHVQSNNNQNNGENSLPADIENTNLVAAITEQNESHPELSGYHPIVTGANAFASRSILTDMATRNIDVQYYIWHDDQAGQLMLKDLWEAAEENANSTQRTIPHKNSPDSIRMALGLF